MRQPWNQAKSTWNALSTRSSHLCCQPSGDLDACAFHCLTPPVPCHCGIPVGMHMFLAVLFPCDVAIDCRTVPTYGLQARTMEAEVQRLQQRCAELEAAAEAADAAHAAAEAQRQEKVSALQARCQSIAARIVELETALDKTTVNRSMDMVRAM